MTTTTPGVANGVAAVPAQSNEQLLMEIFGSSSSTPVAPATAPAPQKSAVDDILSLFGNSPSPAPAAVAPSQPPAMAGGSLFDLGGMSSPAPTPASAPAPAPKPQLTSYTAYEKNDLKITLTPQTNPTKPGLVLILARFQVSGSTPATGISFQAAVPKVRRCPNSLTHELTTVFFRHNSYKCHRSPTRMSILVRRSHSRCVLWLHQGYVSICQSIIWLTVRSFFVLFHRVKSV